MKSNKKLKKEYKNMKFKISVFQVRNIVNGKIFIDSSVNLDKIWNRHRVELNAGMHRNEKLQNDSNEFGENNFLFEILSEIEQNDGENTDYGKEAQQLTKMFIEELKTSGDKGCN